MRHAIALNFCIFFVLFVGCSSTYEETREPVAPVIVSDDDAEKEKDWSIKRTEYESVIKGKLQAVMRWYFVRPYYDGKKFVGYQIADIYKKELQDGPLRKGDVLLRINNMKIERPEHAMAVWRGLWGKKKLKLLILRHKKPKVYTIPIVD